MIEIPLAYLTTTLTIILGIFISLWTAFGLYLLTLRAIIGGVIVLCIAVIFWLVFLSMIEVIIWI